MSGRRQCISHATKLKSDESSKNYLDGYKGYP